jgi:hypothetical protein
VRTNSQAYTILLRLGVGLLTRSGIKKRRLFA